MEFDPKQYGPNVAQLLAVEGNGNRLAPLVCHPPLHPEVGVKLVGSSAASLFPASRRPREALAGLWLYFSYFEEAHQLADASKNADGKLWHGILHRQEPDSGNAAYWFRQAGSHAIFPALAREAGKILKESPEAEFRVGRWDPYAFIGFCDRARDQPNTVQDRVAREIQRVEWQLMFDYCARPV